MFTPTEKKVIVFLCALLLCAGIVRITGIPKTISTQDGSEEALFVNINHAGIDELKRLPFVGVVIARRIVEYRAYHGPFADKEQLKNIKGIGNKKLEVIKKFIVLQ